MSPHQQKLQLIAQTGRRLTKPRQQILTVIDDTPLSVTQIAQKLKLNHIDIDPTTIYRTLDLFCQLKIIQKVYFDDQTIRYEIVSNFQHHHHLICEKCGTVEDIPLSEESLLQQVAQKSKFKINRHSLEFFGVCLHCQQK